MESRRDSLKMAFGEVSLEVREDMLKKHDSGYRVTLHTTLRESAGLDENDGDPCDSVSFLWIKAPSMIQMVRVNGRFAKIVTVVIRGFRVMVVFVFRCWG